MVGHFLIVPMFIIGRADHKGRHYIDLIEPRSTVIESAGIL
jgi:hypothetical protein